MSRANFIGAPEFFNLDLTCRILAEAFDHHVYLVGSSLKIREYRDVDVRAILPDEEFDRMFPGAKSSPHNSAQWSLICAAISEWLATRTNLPIDFQIQRMTEANAEYDGPRNALGIFL